MPPSLVGAEDEGPVVAVVKMRYDHWAAEAAAESIRYQLRLRGGDWVGVRDGIETGGLVVPEGRAVDGVGARLGGHRNFARLAELGDVHRAVGANLGDRLGGREGVGDWVIAGRALHGDAIDGDFGLEGQRTLKRKIAMVLLHARQGADDVQRAGAVGARAGVHRKVLHLGRGVRAADRSRVRVDGADGVGRNDDLLLDIAHRQHSVHAQLLAGLQDKAGGRPPLKAGRGNGNRIAPSRGVEELVVSRPVRHSSADGAVVKALEGHRRAGNDRAGLVFHGAEDAALDGLRLGADETLPG